jgi:hypothetical protein
MSVSDQRVASTMPQPSRLSLKPRPDTNHPTTCPETGTSGSCFVRSRGGVWRRHEVYGAEPADRPPPIEVAPPAAVFDG